LKLDVASFGILLQDLAGSTKPLAGGMDDSKSSTKTLSDFGNLVSVVVQHLLIPLQEREEIADFRSVFKVTGQMLNAGYFSCIRQVEDYIINLSRASISEYSAKEFRD